MQKIQADFFYILSSAVNENNVNWNLFENYSSEAWMQLYALSQQQGVVAVVFEKIKTAPQNVAPPRTLSLKWLSHSLYIEKMMRKRTQLAIEFAEKLSEQNVQTVVLKGLSFASYYPNSYHRESGDLDCYLLGQKEIGDKAIVEFGGLMKEAGYKHSHLYYKGLTIENHRYLTSFDNTQLGLFTERTFQTLISEECRHLGETKLLKPSADFNALFLIKHAQRHFIKEGIRIRYLLDWAFFLKAESTNVNWSKVIPLMSECHILHFAQVMTALCVEHLGLESNVDALNVKSKIDGTVLADVLGGQPDLFRENIFQKIGRISRRFYRMWKFRSLADESYLQMVWNNIVYSSYFRKY